MRNIFQQFITLLWLGTLPSLVVAHEGSDYGPHMMWQSYGMFFGPMMMIGFIAVVVIVATFLFRWFGSSANSQNFGSYPNSDRDPVNILKERFANDEIDKEEFEERKRLLCEK